MDILTLFFYIVSSANQFLYSDVMIYVSACAILLALLELMLHIFYGLIGRSN